MEHQLHTIPLQQAIENAHKERAAAFTSLWKNWFGLRAAFAPLAVMQAT
ncbi:hypothetical protein [Thalassobacter stenotrophicus]|uniref:Uncharacterized protein n=2 Tax=Thalassobacter stenotrophicus TaxID=266809 RepID=A0A0P1F2N4_9RHOB|nr:hypothetical protein [Thalassobacter stenotrophicus]CUH61764.1 hypothetical protein THS5294_03076 [Thalassobacter stenotrophicus]SHI42838.1 hypothetical protein SAMN02744035_00559 [Thalassobacter stenotrophicus DSM 16310]